MCARTVLHCFEPERGGCAYMHKHRLRKGTWLCLWFWLNSTWKFVAIFILPNCIITKQQLKNDASFPFSHGRIFIPWKLLVRVASFFSFIRCLFFAFSIPPSRSHMLHSAVTKIAGFCRASFYVGKHFVFCHFVASNRFLYAHLRMRFVVADAKNLIREKVANWQNRHKHSSTKQSVALSVWRSRMCEKSTKFSLHSHDTRKYA